MQGFSTKKEFLEYLGKNPDDRKLVDRLIHRGKARMIDGLYYLVDKDARIAELEEEVEELRGRIATFKEENWDLEYAKTQWEYYEEEYNKEVEDKQNRIRKCFLWIKQKVKWADWEEFRDWVMSDEE